eukprot:scaffold30597_cov28-Tisochrysis_lutea.AAC.1
MHRLSTARPLTSAPRATRGANRTGCSAAPSCWCPSGPVQARSLAVVVRRLHFSTSRWPPCAAHRQVSSSHGQPCSRTHRSTSRWPPFAFAAHRKARLAQEVEVGRSNKAF